MRVCFKKLCKLLIDRDMKKKDLRIATGISPTTLVKLGRDENINTVILCKICDVLKCDISEIMEMISLDVIPADKQKTVR